MNGNATGLLLVAFATAVFAFIFTGAKLFAGEVSVFQVVFLRFFGSFLTLGAIWAIVPSFRRKAGRSSVPAAHLRRVLFGALGGAAATYAAAGMPVINAAAVGLLEGAFTMVIAVLLLGEIVTRRHALAAVVCALGAAVAVFGRGEGAWTDGAWGGIELDPRYLLPTIVALAGAVLMALENVYLRKVALADTPQTALVHTNLFGAAVIAPLALATWQPLDLVTLGLVLLLGPLQVLAQFANLKGFAAADLSIIAPVAYSWVIFAALVGWALYGEVPTSTDLAGAILVLAGGLWLSRLPSAKARKSRAVRAAAT